MAHVMKWRKCRRQQRSKILYSFSRRVSSTTVPSVARLRGGFNPWRMAGKSTCGHAHGHTRLAHIMAQFRTMRSHS
jgi:hypothetical protein